jgi:hypothetical protein
MPILCANFRSLLMVLSRLLILFKTGGAGDVQLPKQRLQNFCWDRSLHGTRIKRRQPPRPWRGPLGRALRSLTPPAMLLDPTDGGTVQSIDRWGDPTIVQRPGRNGATWMLWVADLAQHTQIFEAIVASSDDEIVLEVETSRTSHCIPMENMRSSRGIRSVLGCVGLASTLVKAPNSRPAIIAFTRRESGSKFVLLSAA